MVFQVIAKLNIAKLFMCIIWSDTVSSHQAWTTSMHWFTANWLATSTGCKWHRTCWPGCDVSGPTFHQRYWVMSATPLVASRPSHVQASGHHPEDKIYWHHGLTTSPHPQPSTSTHYDHPTNLFSVTGLDGKSIVSSSSSVCNSLYITTDWLSIAACLSVFYILKNELFDISYSECKHPV